MKHLFVIGLFWTAASPCFAQDPAQTFLSGVAELSVVECHTLADRILTVDEPGTSAQALNLLSRAVREQCYLTAMRAEPSAPQLGFFGGLLRGRPNNEDAEAQDESLSSGDRAEGGQPSVFRKDMQTRAKAAETLLRSAMAADSGVQNDLLRRLLGQDPVPKR